MFKYKYNMRVPGKGGSGHHCSPSLHTVPFDHPHLSPVQKSLLSFTDFLYVLGSGLSNGDKKRSKMQFLPFRGVSMWSAAWDLEKWR